MDQRPAAHAAAGASAAFAALSTPGPTPDTCCRRGLGIQPSLCRHAGAWPVPGHDCGCGLARAARDRDVGLSAVVIRAAGAVAILEAPRTARSEERRVGKECRS